MGELIVVPTLHGHRVWLVAEQEPDHAPTVRRMQQMLLEAGADEVLLLPPGRFMTRSARMWLESGAEKLVRGLRRALGIGERNADDGPLEEWPTLVLADDPEVLGRLDRWRQVVKAEVLLVGMLYDRRRMERWSRSPGDAFLLADPGQIAMLDRGDLVAEAFAAIGPPLDALDLGEVDRESIRERYQMGIVPTLLFDLSPMAPQDITDLVGSCRRLVGDRPLKLLAFDRGVHLGQADAVRQAAAWYGVRMERFDQEGLCRDLVAAADVVVLSGGSSWWPWVIAWEKRAVVYGAEGRWSAQLDPPSVVSARDGWQVTESLLRVLAEGRDGRARVQARHVQRFLRASLVETLLGWWQRRLELHRRVGPAPGAPSPAGVAFEVVGEEVARARAARTSGGWESVQAGPPPGRAPETIRERMTSLVLARRRAQERWESSVGERDKWMRRAQLAADQGASELASVAEERVRAAQRAAEEARGELDRVAHEIDGLRARGGGVAPPPSGADEESAFRDLELRADIERMRRESAEDDPTSPRGEG